MLKHLFLLPLLILTIFSGCAIAQSGYSTSNKKAIKLYEEARRAPSEQINIKTGQPNYQAGIDLLDKALEKDNKFLEAHQLIGEFYRLQGNSKKAVYHFKESLSINPRANLNGLLYFDIGELQMKNGNYADAVQYFDILLNGRHPAMSDELLWAAEKLKENALFAMESMKNPMKIDPKNIGPGINTKHPEYFPTITVDGRTLLFTRLVPTNNPTLIGQEDFFVSQLSDKNIWQEAVPMPTNINTSNNEGAPTLSADGRTLIFVACADITGYDFGPGREGKGRCDLFITKRLGSQWMNPRNLPGGVNTAQWESQPSLSADGKTLYFVRRVGRQGTERSDIFVSVKNEDGTWGTAEPIKGNINTQFMETSVQIHPDGQTLYFSSNGHTGMGGYDIFMSRKDPLGNWGDPINLGYPINTENDENSLLVGPDGEVAFFASNRPGGFGDLDIYYFEMPEELRPVKTTYFEGLVYDGTTRKPVGGKFELIDLSTGKQVIQSEADKITGEFLVALPTGRKYALNVSYPGYAFFSKNFDMIDQPEEAIHMDVPLVPMESESAITLANVFFDVDKATLRKESYAELNKLVEFLNENKSVKIEIGGHTDTRGDAKANQILSENRAKAVYEYLIEKGIRADRLTYKGYGETKPIYSDEAIEAMETEAAREKAHQANRRTEYRIVK
ncbi:MAG: OmpA family protein [Brumimicrobium sp.]|nr:OmpA family protein [Brumimicrobium sp.]